MIGRWRKKRRLQDNSEPIVLEGLAKSAGGQGRTRILMTMAVFFAIYGVIAGRLVWFGTQELEQGGPGPSRVTASRPDIVDRNGQVLATDINTSSLFAEPRRIVDADEALEKLLTVLPDLNVEQTYNRLQSDAGFMWLRRQLTPRQEQAIMQLGIPGIGFRSEKRRFYPGGPTAAHIVGLVNVDNKGIAGMEKYVDDQGLADLQASGLAVARDLEPVRLSIDLRVQHIVRDELERAMERYKALAAGAVVLNARTGEVLAMASLPDFDPNNPFNAHEKDRLNRMSAGVYEMGSTFKGFTVAMALEKGTATLNSRFDATRPIQIARHTIRDFHGKGRVLTVPEVFIFSSNIGTARMAETVEVNEHRAFFRQIGLLDRMETELPEVARPTEPAEWKRINQITIAFGHGVATTPLQTAMSGAAMLNGGKLMQPTFLPRSEAEADQVAQQVISPRTSQMMRYLFRLNVEKGSGKRGEVPGYFVGGKTGTAEKVVNGRYVSGKRFNAFLAGFPVNDPDYVVLTVLDEPQPDRPGGGATAGVNTTQVAADIIRRSAAMLGVKPDFGHESQALLVSSN
ncbi:peptidoglycan D,D-transpeptidase FtsI family protein [Aerobium aerolatum]|uniref:Cell division protein FtsI (Penicillin-binding protein 3) n=1 Tax=Aquamicrobium aerolatum DSM 21857 TaxID=1121003 RepID=A0A1I3QV80_9HYPH|nr:penicillin-binding protein 2 [Aquamicrobium aerolatum]SFJ37382.1 cell division protein FtsI (penicillin-binding protein 3) [Aquamicrobium aerolatum DSM 21857]